MPYKIKIKRRVIKALVKIDEPNYSKIKNGIYELANNPMPSGYKKIQNRIGYRIRIGDYRVLYEINNEMILIEVIELGHRKDIYN